MRNRPRLDSARVVKDKGTRHVESLASLPTKHLFIPITEHVYRRGVENLQFQKVDTFVFVELQESAGVAVSDESAVLLEFDLVVAFHHLPY